MLVVSILLASCNTGNKVVSSFGKRKYTKGYFFNFGSHKKLELPQVATHENKPVNITTSKKGATAVQQFIDGAKGNKIAKQPNNISTHLAKLKSSLFHPLQNIISKKQDAITNTSSENISGNAPGGVPGHGSTSDSSNNEGDSDAKAGGVLGLLSAFLIAVLFIIPSTFSGGALVFVIIGSAIAAVAGLASSIAGLKSHEYFINAVMGLVLSILALIFWIVIFLAVASFLSGI